MIASDVVICHVLSSGLVVAMLTQVLRSRYVAAYLIQAPLPWLYFAKLVRRTMLQFRATLGLIGLLMYLLSVTPSNIRPYKLEFYVNCLFSHLFI